MSSTQQHAQTASCIVNPHGPAPRGISDFTELVEDGFVFVDKTLFIKEVLDAGDKVILLTRPRRFGKTINLNMLRCFLHWPVGEGKSGDLFEGLAISQAGKRYQQERGKRPVLFLTFKDIKAENWHNAWIGMRGMLSVIAETHSHGAPVEQLPLEQARVLHDVIDSKAEPAQCRCILAILTKLLTLKHNDMTPWVLIDEYDTPMHAAYQHGYYKQMRDLMRGLLGQCLKDNEDPLQPRTFLHKAVLTGIVRVAKEDIFSDLNNLGTFGVLDDRFAGFFGFTQSEVKALLAARGLSHQFDAVRQWYDGYCFGNEHPVTIYNPWSVVSHLANPTRDPEPHWVNTSDNSLIGKLLTPADTTIKQGLQQLLDGQNRVTTQVLRQHIPLRELQTDSHNLWALLLASGYLTAQSHEGVRGSVARQARLRIPNEEVLGVYGDLVRLWLRGGERGSGSGVQLLDALVAGEPEEFAEEFPKLVAESISYFDTGGDHPERFYHGFVLGMMQHLRGCYVVRSERESGAGRVDVILEPKEKQRCGFVMEFKKGLYADGTLEQAADRALQQITEKQYHADLLNRGVQQVIALGLAFRGKSVVVKHERLPLAEPISRG